MSPAEVPLYLLWHTVSRKKFWMEKNMRSEARWHTYCVVTINLHPDNTDKKSICPTSGHFVKDSPGLCGRLSHSRELPSSSNSLKEQKSDTHRGRKTHSEVQTPTKLAANNTITIISGCVCGWVCVRDLVVGCVHLSNICLQNTARPWLTSHAACCIPSGWILMCLDLMQIFFRNCKVKRIWSSSCYFPPVPLICTHTPCMCGW